MRRRLRHWIGRRLEVVARWCLRDSGHLIVTVLHGGERLGTSGNPNAQVRTEEAA